MRKLLIIVGAAVVLGIGVVLLSPRSSEPTLPELARDLPSGSWETADLAFKQRVRSRFSVGEPAQDVLRALEAQGFKLASDNKSASFDQPGFPCRLVWRVFWTSDTAGNIRRIDGVFAGICL